MHALRAAHVGDDLTNGSRLRAGERKRHLALEPRCQGTPVGERDPGAALAGQLARTVLKEVDEEQLLEREPGTSMHRLGQRGRPVHHPQRFGQRRDPGPRDHCCRKMLGHVRQQCIEVGLDERADLLDRYSLGRWINGQNSSVRLLILFRTEVDELSWHQLPAMKESHRPGGEKHVTLANDALEKRLSRPRHLEQT